jgi:hypothetical protein
MRSPESDTEKFLAARIDKKGEAILTEGADWEEGVMKFSHPFDNLTEREQAFVDERLSEWKTRISSRRRS